mmetsp:Transcript_17724/g.36126  ORF Transcript_17724/g.36126 Transcript_17724/m.36126 type:complete len:86 (+) Transcript_17724:143-400(+)
MKSSPPSILLVAGAWNHQWYVGHGPLRCVHSSFEGLIPSIMATADNHQTFMESTQIMDSIPVKFPEQLSHFPDDSAALSSLDSFP